MARRRHATPAPPYRTLAGVLAGCLLLLPVLGHAQAGSDLRRLFFDAVYLSEQDGVLLSSGAREGYPSTGASTPAAGEPSRPLSDLLTDIDAYQAQIDDLIETNGIFNPGLAQEYLALGDAQAQAGEYEAAVAAYENAMHVDRVNEGLYTLSQTDAVQRLIDINKRSRQYGEADKYHQYLYYLLTRNLEPGSDALRQATLQWADWNLEAFHRMAFNQENGLSISGDVTSAPAAMLRRGEMIAIVDRNSPDVLFVPRNVLYTGGSDMRMQAYTAEQLVDPRLKHAEDLYDRLLDDDATDMAILRKKANILYLFKYQLQQYISVDILNPTLTSSPNNLVRSISFLRRGYADNRDTLEELAASLATDNPREAARVYIDLGDWELEFDRSARAADAYKTAYDLLVADGMSDIEATTFITPEPAILAPEFVSHEYSRRFQNIPDTEDIPYIGYIDVTFNKRENGVLRNIEIVSASENTNQALRSRLIDMLQDVKMRPLIVGGEQQEQHDIKVRYYYSF